MPHRFIPLAACLLAACSNESRTDTGQTPAQPAPAAEAEVGAGSLPLTPGVYVMEGRDCRAPANAAFVVYDGMGLHGSATRNCEMTVKSQNGGVYEVSQSCENTYDGSRATEDQVIEVPAADRLAFRGDDARGAFRLCSPDETPDWLK